MPLNVTALISDFPINAFVKAMKENPQAPMQAVQAFKDCVARNMRQSLSVFFPDADLNLSLIYKDALKAEVRTLAYRCLNGAEKEQDSPRRSIFTTAANAWADKEILKDDGKMFAFLSAVASKLQEPALHASGPRELDPPSPP